MVCGGRGGVGSIDWRVCLSSSLSNDFHDSKLSTDRNKSLYTKTIKKYCMLERNVLTSSTRASGISTSSPPITTLTCAEAEQLESAINLHKATMNFEPEVCSKSKRKGSYLRPAPVCWLSGDRVRS